jgi:membrane protease YdiL (CAAX protease family)
MHQAVIRKSICRPHTLTVKPRKQRGGASSVKTFVVIKNPAFHVICLTKSAAFGGRKSLRIFTPRKLSSQLAKPFRNQQLLPNVYPPVTEDPALHESTYDLESPIPPAQPSTLRRIFFGADGLRAGWSLCIFIAIFAAFISSLTFIGHRTHLLPPRPSKNAPAQPMAPLFGILAEAIPFLLTLFVTWIMSRIEKRPIAVYGLGGTRKLPLFFNGLAWGVVCLSILVLTLVKTGLLVIDGRLLFGSDAFRYGAVWLVGFLLVGLLEEYLTRGYLQYTLTRGLAGIYKWAFKTRHSTALGFWTAALIFSVLFGLGHGDNPGESPIGLLSAGLAAMVFCLSLWRTGSLWWAIGFHASWDWAQSFLYGVADSGTFVKYHLLATHPVGKPILSGGSTGPEGSVFVLGVLALIAIIILVTLPRTPHTSQLDGSVPPQPIEA